MKYEKISMENTRIPKTRVAGYDCEQVPREHFIVIKVGMSDDEYVSLYWVDKNNDKYSELVDGLDDLVRKHYPEIDDGKFEWERYDYIPHEEDEIGLIYSREAGTM